MSDIAEQIRSGAEKISWYHTIDLGHGVLTKGADNTPARLDRMGLPDNLEGQTVLDIGAWDGFFSFEAEKRGAQRVLATDFFCWGGGGWGTKDGFSFARETLHSKVEDLDIDVDNIAPSTVGCFDVVLFLGVLYHLKDPLGALQRVAAVTKRLLVLETAVDLLPMARPAMAFYPANELENDPTNWWGPNLACVEAMLRVCGFREVRCVQRHYVAHWLGWAGRGIGLPLRKFRRGRAAFHALK